MNQKPNYGNWVPEKLLYLTFGGAALFLVLALLSGLAFSNTPLAVICAILCAVLLAFGIYMYACHECFAFGKGDMMAKVHAHLVAHLNWDGHGTLLDIGCGAAPLTVRCAKAFPDAALIGMDYWGAQWNYAKEQCEKNAAIEGVASRIHFEKGDAAHLNYADETFDAAVSNFVFHEVHSARDKRDVVREALRVVKRGGAFSFQDLFAQKRARLEELGELDNTLVIVTSDNGMPFPRAKGTQYEYAHHMPLAMMWPQGVNSPGRREAVYVSFVDIAPTILEIAGTDPSAAGMAPLPGGSLVPLLRNEPDPCAALRERALLGRERHDNGRPGDQGYPIRGIVRGGWLYLCNLKPWLLPGGNPETGYRDIDSSPTKTAILQLRRSGQDRRYYDLSMGQRPAEELYHVETDRECLANRIGDVSCRILADSLRAELFRTLREQGDPRMTGDGDVFDRYPYDKPGKDSVYERTVSGEIIPWEQSNWVLPTDYEQYETVKNN